MRSTPIVLFDQTRSRSIPIQIYLSQRAKAKALRAHKPMPVVVISHGYRMKNTEYSAIADYLAEKGFFVASIQDDLTTDPHLKHSGTLYQRRKPLWDKGVLNILFAEKALHKLYPFIEINKVILLGHSNGGDISILFAKNYPNSVKAVISLDSLRVPFPRDGKIPILSIRANNTKSDPAVLPDKKDWKKLHMMIVNLNDAKHIDLSDRGSPVIQQEINSIIEHFLTNENLK
jgi:dienelactone hydrolase